MRFVKSALCPALLCLAVAFAYGRTLDIPWYFDDIQSIVENPLMRNLVASLKLLFQPRGLVDISFALNYHFGLSEPFGYHLVNIVLHWLVSVLVWWILSQGLGFRRSVALCGALFFALHPLQTQAVDYIVQRSVLLAALFALGSVALFLAAEENFKAERDDVLFYQHWRPRFLWLLALLCAAAAVITKQNTATLPALIFLCAYYRNPLRWRKLVLRLVPFLLAPLAVFIKMVVVPAQAGSDLVVITTVRELGNMQALSPLNYFATELSVLFLYVKMLLWPVGLRLDYAYPVTAQPFALIPLLLLGLHLAILIGAFLARKRFFALFFAVFWFYISLFVESSFLPLDPIFEHRLYLPLLGPVVLFCALLQGGIRRSPLVLVAAAMLLLILGGMSWQRNELWRDPIAFSEDNARKSPHSEGPLVALAGRYLEAGRLDEALLASQRALAINAEYFRTYINLSSIYLEQGKPFEARRAALAGLVRASGDMKLRRNLAIAYLQTGQVPKGRALLTEILAQSGADYALRVLLGQSYLDAKGWQAAERELQRAIELGTQGDSLPYYLHGIALYEQRKLESAVASLRTALKMNPEDVQTLSGLGYILLEQGESTAALDMAARLESQDPQAAATLRGAIRRLYP